MSDQLKALNSNQLDALKEIGNIGAGNAATALAQLLNRKVNMKVPEVNILSFNDIIEVLGGPENVVAGIYLRVSGGITGNILFLLPKENAVKMLDILLGKQRDSTDDFNPIERSALLEVGNILTGAYLAALSSLTNMTFIPSVPALAVDMVGAILSVPLSQYGYMGDTALLIDTEFEEGEYQVRGHFFLIPDLDIFDKLFSAIGGVQ